MCTLLLAWRAFADAPVVVAANRDEYLDRPSIPPRAVGDDPRVVAPGDDRAGGTWIGYNDAGVLVALTNRWNGTEGERSRGLLVRDALDRTGAEAAARFVERELDRREYAGFNLVVADATAAVLFEWDGRLRARNLEPGLHAVMNVGANDRFEAPPGREDAAREQADAARRLRADLHPEPGEGAEEWLDRAAAALGDHDYGVCVHRGEFGTRSSSLIALYADGTASYRFADGPPCRTAYEPVADGQI